MAQEQLKRDFAEDEWNKVLKYTLLVYLVLTCLACYYRADFISLTVIILGMFQVEHPEMSRRVVFRAVVACVALSFFSDLIHLLFLHDSSEDEEADGGISNGVRNFAYFFAWISFLIRPIVFFVMWHVSLNYMSIVKGKSKADSSHNEV